MNFLAPLFLAGAAALVLPMVFHLIRRKTREQVPFSSLMFLRVSPPRLTKRSRLEDLLLLLLRCLVLALLAAAFARPFVRRPLALPDIRGTSRRELILVDTSASMRRNGLWDAARARLVATVEAAAPGDSLAVYAFDRRMRPVVTFADWTSRPTAERAALVRSRLDALTPAWGASDLGTALVRAAEELTDASTTRPGESLQIRLISDLSEGDRVQALASFEWPKSVRLVVDPVKPKTTGNAGVQWLSGGSGATVKVGDGVRVRVSNSGDATRDAFSVAWVRSGAKEPYGTPVAVYVPPGQSRIATLPLPGTNAPPDLSEVLLLGDLEAFDNRVGVIPPEPTPVQLLYLGADAAKEDGAAGSASVHGPLFFLRHALEGNPQQKVRITTQPAAAALAAADLVVITGDLSEDRIAPIRERLTAGGMVLLVLSPEGGSATVSALSGVRGVTVEEARVKGDTLLGDLDFKHPFLLPFADPRYSDFSHIHFWKYRRLEVAALPGARVPARFETGDPALVELPVGKGRLVVLTSGWQPSDSQLAVSTKFVPLLQSMLESAGVGSVPVAAFTVGDSVPLDLHDMGAVRIRSPRGELFPLSTGSAAFEATTEPGVYAVESAGAEGSTPRVVRRFAVNVDPQESHIQPLPLETLERFGAPATAAADSPRAIARTNPATAGVLAAIEAEARQKLWKWCLSAAFALALGETAVAAFSAQRSRARQGRESLQTSDPVPS